MRDSSPIRVAAKETKVLRDGSQRDQKLIKRERGSGKNVMKTEKGKCKFFNATRKIVH